MTETEVCLPEVGLASDELCGGSGMDTTDVGREKVASRSAEVTKEVGWTSEEVENPSTSGLGDDSSGKSSNSSPVIFQPVVKRHFLDYAQWGKVACSSAYIVHAAYWNFKKVKCP